MDAERCVHCDEIIPEGNWDCYRCRKKAERNEKNGSVDAIHDRVYLRDVFGDSRYENDCK